MHNKKNKLEIISIIIILFSIIILAGRYYIHDYDAGIDGKVYPQLCIAADITDDMSMIAINDNTDTVYCINRDDNSVRFILNEKDFDADKFGISEVQYDSDNNLYVYIFEFDKNIKYILSEKIMKFDTEGRLIKSYLLDNSIKNNTTQKHYGLYVKDGYIYYVKRYRKGLGICSINIESGEMNNIVQFTLTNNNNIVSAEYDNNDYIVVLSDGSVMRYGLNGSEQYIDRFNFELGNYSDDNVYVDRFVHAGDEYYFLDRKFYDSIYSYRDGTYKKEYTLKELLGWEDNIEENDNDEYHNLIVENEILCMCSHKDILLFASAANMYIVKDGSIDTIPATDEGLNLRGIYRFLAIYRVVSLYVGAALFGCGILLLLIYIIRYRFTVLNKTILILVPIIFVAFGIITYFVEESVMKMYMEVAGEKMQAVSSLAAGSLDKELIKELNDLDDVRNGNVEKLRTHFKEIVEDYAGWNDSLIFNLFEYDDGPCNYTLIDYPNSENLYLGSYFLQKIEDFEEKRVGESNTYQTTTADPANRYIDVITVIYDGEKPIAMLDVYGYMDDLNEEVAGIQQSILIFAVIFTLFVIVLLIILASYITRNLHYASNVIEQISDGNMNARVKKIHKDEIGVVSSGINNMAAQLEHLFKTREEFSKEVIETLVGTIDAKDKYTNGHSIRVAKYSKEIARRLGKSEKEQDDIYYAGLLHDIGKIGIPDDIINKTTKLSSDEYSVIMTHPSIGYDLLKKLSQINNIYVGAYGHHERYDGKGYPQGLAGEEIPEIARIIGVADAYDAMTSNRSYRDALTEDAVRSEIENGRNTQFDPVIADIMLEIDRQWSGEV